MSCWQTKYEYFRTPSVSLLLQRYAIGRLQCPQNGMPVSEDAALTLYARWKELVISSFSMKKTEATNSAEMTFDAAAGSEYEIQWKPSLDAEWKVLKSVIADKDGELPVSVDVPDSDTGFFRLRLVDEE